MQQPAHTSTSVVTVDTLVTLLTRQKIIVEQLCSCGAEQSRMIESGRSDELLGLLQRRQNLIDDFASAQREFQQCQSHLADQLSREDESSQQRIRSLVEEISAGIEGVLTRDARDEQSLQERRTQVRNEIQRLDTVQSARAAYRQPPLAMNRFADQQG